MKITLNQLRRIVRQEIINEGFVSPSLEDLRASANEDMPDDNYNDDDYKTKYKPKGRGNKKCPCCGRPMNDDSEGAASLSYGGNDDGLPDLNAIRDKALIKIRK